MIDWKEFAFIIFLVLIVIGITLMIFGVINMIFGAQVIDCSCVDPNKNPNLCVGV